MIIEYLSGDGSYDSDECISLLQEADIVCTNPPFSLFRNYVALLMRYNKKFIIIGNKNAITYKEIFPLIKNNELWVGMTPMGYDMKFLVNEEDTKELVETRKEGSAFVRDNDRVLARAQAIWFTNVGNKKRHEELDLYKKYNPEEYPKYDNYDAIEVSKVCEIPMDYEGVMGVPITFLDKYCPTQFEIIGCCEPCIDIEVYKKAYFFKNIPSRQINRNGKLCQKTYHRILVKRINKN